MKPIQKEINIHQDLRPLNNPWKVSPKVGALSAWQDVLYGNYQQLFLNDRFDWLIDYPTIVSLPA